MQYIYLIYYKTWNLWTASYVAIQCSGWVHEYTGVRCGRFATTGVRPPLQLHANYTSSHKLSLGLPWAIPYFIIETVRQKSTDKFGFCYHIISELENKLIIVCSTFHEIIRKLHTLSSHRSSYVKVKRKVNNNTSTTKMLILIEIRMFWKEVYLGLYLSYTDKIKYTYQWGYLFLT